MEGEQQLFLMEFLVDRVNIPAMRAVHEEILPITTCVSFQILNLPPISIYQETPVEGCACLEGDTQVFNKGKSCLFALPTMVLQRPINNFPVTMTVYKKLPPGVLPDVMIVGSHQIQVTNLINAVLRERAFTGGSPYQRLKETFRISTPTGQCVGEVMVFIRASCYGKKIVTQFQIPHNRKPFLFKGDRNDGPVFQCKRIPSRVRNPNASYNQKCTCVPLKSNDGSGEACQKTCCSPTCCSPPPDPKPCCTPRRKSAGYKHKPRQCPPDPAVIASEACANCCSPAPCSPPPPCLPSPSPSPPCSSCCSPLPCPPVPCPPNPCTAPACVGMSPITCIPCCGSPTKVPQPFAALMQSQKPVELPRCKPTSTPPSKTFQFGELFKKTDEPVKVKKCGCTEKNVPKCNCSN